MATMLKYAKHLAISVGLYKPARKLHRTIFRSERAKFLGYKRLYANFIRPGDLVFDVGASIGARTEIMLALGAKVIAFEPQPECAREIRARNNGNLTVVEKAVGSEPSVGSLHLTTSPALASFEPVEVETGSLTVEITTLDEAIQKFGRPKFCKIDVEGFEVEVLKGLSQPIRGLSLEYHCHQAYLMVACFEILRKFGDFSANLTVHEGSDLILPDWLPSQDFLNLFPDCAAPYAYGDVFIRFH